MDTGPSSAKFFTLAVGCLITTFPFFLSTGGAGFACTGATFTAPLAPSTRAAGARYKKTDDPLHNIQNLTRKPSCVDGLEGLSQPSAGQKG